MSKCATVTLLDLAVIHFPDRCVGCNTPWPEKSVTLTSEKWYGWRTWLPYWLPWVHPVVRVRFPVCRQCRAVIRREQLLFTITAVALGLAIFWLVHRHWSIAPRSSRRWMTNSLIILAVLPVWLTHRIWPAPVTISAIDGRIRYRFADPAYAAEFARENGVSIDDEERAGPPRHLRIATLMLLGIVVLVPAPDMWDRVSFASVPAGVVADGIIVTKSDRTLRLYREGSEIKTYRIALGRQPVGAKSEEGDQRTPEGRYAIDGRKADSRFHRALHISYPDAQDIERAASRGRNPGNLIMIHGLRNGLGFLGPLHRTVDWTDGCIAVTNREIEELWRVVPDGTPILILP